MRCKNCGWPNEPNASRCVKCNASLSGATSMSEPASQPSYSPEPAENLKSTLRESSAFGTVDPKPETEQTSGTFGSRPEQSSHIHQSQGGADTLICPDCGYKRSPNIMTCPICGHKFGDKAAASEPLRSRNPFEHQTNPPQGGGGRYAGTINPWMQPAEESSFCTLQRIPWQNEKVTYEPVSYSGQEIVLNRSNTDNNNNSITSRTQAILTQENGKWFIEDGSEMHTTLIRVNRKVELQDGDVIVLGNRMFEFRKG